VRSSAAIADFLVTRLTGAVFMICFSIMRRASVADLRNHFRRISAWIEDGETVEIVKRGRAFARLMPIAEPGKAVKVDFQAQRKRIWGNRVFSSAEIKAMDDAELGDVER
jgi:antitoxin (DNA-binding transcriptional repressor) of toxin-antitoxin stability system